MRCRRGGAGTLAGLIAAFALACTTSTPAHALGRDRQVHQFHHQSWTPRQGAPSQVWSLAQTADGYLWIGSATGLFRFDGVRFERYTPPDGAALPSHNVLVLHAPPEGGLHVGFRGGGAVFIEAGQMRVTVAPDDEAIRRPVDFTRDAQGRTWAATASGPAVFEDMRWRSIGAESGWPGTPAFAVFFDRQGTLWASAQGAIWFRTSDADRFQKLDGEFGQVARFAESPDGTLWMAEVTRAVRPVPVPGTPADAPEFIMGSINLKFDHDGSLWASTLGSGVKRIRVPEAARAGDETETYVQADDLTSDYATAVLVDREGSVWIGTDKGLDRFRVGRLIPVAVPAGHTGLTLVAADDGVIWAGSDSTKPMLRVADDVAVAPPGIHQNAAGMNAVYRDPHGATWWGGLYGLWEQRGESFIAHGLPPGIEPAQMRFLAIRPESGGGLALETFPNATYRFEDGAWSRGERAAGLPDAAPSAVFVDADARSWFGYPDGRVFVLDGDTARDVANAGVGRVQVIRGDGDGRWIGGEQGLARWAGGTMRRVDLIGPERLLNVTAIVAPRSGDLWLAHSLGILRVAASELSVEPGGTPLAVRGERFGFLDCLPGAPQVNVLDSAAIEGSDGRLWFATDAGLATVDPRRILDSREPPAVAITGIATELGDFAPTGAPRLPIGTRGLRIAYTALSLAEPERLRFRYRLDGVDPDWQHAGARREAVYTNLDPGEYRFEVSTASDNDIWREPATALAFAIPPAFWQTRWFVALALASGAALLWLAYAVRMRTVSAALRARMEERLVERERIARELHDTLLQGVHGLLLRFQAGVERIPQVEPARLMLERALDRADEVLAEGRDRVRDLRTHAGSGDELSQAVAIAGRELAQDDSTAFRSRADGAPVALHPIVYEEALRIAREALINAFQHAHAGAVEAEVAYGAHELRLRVHDDGRGIDAATLEAGGHPGHWGLTGMRERARKVGGQLDIRSAPGDGTTVEMRVPASVAYRVRREDATRRKWWRRAPVGE